MKKLLLLTGFLTALFGSAKGQLLSISGGDIHTNAVRDSIQMVFIMLSTDAKTDTTADSVVFLRYKVDGTGDGAFLDRTQTTVDTFNMTNHAGDIGAFTKVVRASDGTTGQYLVRAIGYKGGPGLRQQAVIGYTVFDSCPRTWTGTPCPIFAGRNSDTTRPDFGNIIGLLDPAEAPSLLEVGDTAALRGNIVSQKIDVSAAGEAEANVLSWNGTAVATPTTAGIPEVELANTATHGGAAFLLTGDRMNFTSTSGSAWNLTGQGSGAGLALTGGAVGAGGAGLSASGGGTGSPGIQLNPTGASPSIAAAGDVATAPIFVLKATTHTGAVIPTVTNVTNEVRIVSSESLRIVTATDTSRNSINAGFDGSTRTSILTDASGNVDLSWANIQTPAAVVGLSGTTIKAVTDPVTVGTNNDKTGYSLTDAERDSLARRNAFRLYGIALNGKNLLVNPDFEIQDSVNGSPTGWTAFGGGGQTQVTQVKAQTGKWSLYNATTSGTTRYRSRRFWAPAGLLHYGTSYYDSGGASTTLRVSLHDTIGGVIAYDSLFLTRYNMSGGAGTSNGFNRQSKKFYNTVARPMEFNLICPNNDTVYFDNPFVRFDDTTTATASLSAADRDEIADVTLTRLRGTVATGSTTGKIISSQFVGFSDDEFANNMIVFAATASVGVRRHTAYVTRFFNTGDSAVIRPVMPFAPATGDSFFILGLLGKTVSTDSTQSLGGAAGGAGAFLCSLLVIDSAAATPVQGVLVWVTTSGAFTAGSLTSNSAGNVVFNLDNGTHAAHIFSSGVRLATNADTVINIASANFKDTITTVGIVPSTTPAAGKTLVYGDIRSVTGDSNIVGVEVWAEPVKSGTRCCDADTVAATFVIPKMQRADFKTGGRWEIELYPSTSLNPDSDYRFHIKWPGGQFTKVVTVPVTTPYRLNWAW